MNRTITCPQCGHSITTFRNPAPTVDIIIRVGTGVVLIKRKNPPFGWALPGGFIDYGEPAESAAVREAKEETCLDITDVRQFRVYSDPDRDPRGHTLAVVFIARAEGLPCGADDAAEAVIFAKDDLPESLAFDHAQILRDYFDDEAGRGR
jgi:ADP-ribose pyrophosphatase YjhB (NUDIX family)